MRMKLVLIILVSISPIIALSGTGISTDNLDIAETVLRYEFKNANSSGQDMIYFIEIEGKDPDDNFMKRFEDHKPLVKKGSQCSTDKMGVRDRATGHSGEIFSVKKIVFISKDYATVDCEHYMPINNDVVKIYYLTRVNRKWIIKTVIPGPVSLNFGIKINSFNLILKHFC
jgi:hypothetical protein